MNGQRFGFGHGRGQGGGVGSGRRARCGQDGQSMGAAGSCVCPKCGWKAPHRPGVPCLEERCAECGAALVREGSPHHRQITSRNGGPDAATDDG